MYTDIVLLYDFNSGNDQFLKEILKYPCVLMLLPSISQEEQKINGGLFLFAIKVLIFLVPCGFELTTAITHLFEFLHLPRLRFRCLLAGGK